MMTVSNFNIFYNNNNYNVNKLNVEFLHGYSFNTEMPVLCNVSFGNNEQDFLFSIDIIIPKEIVEIWDNDDVIYTYIKTLLNITQ